MNTTDRSTGSIDYAVRRRFAFITLKAERSAIEDFYNKNTSNNDLKTKALKWFDDVSNFIGTHKSELEFDDLVPGHSYFMAKTEKELNQKFKYEVLPLLEEYKKDGLLSGSFENWQQQLD